MPVPEDTDAGHGRGTEQCPACRLERHESRLAEAPTDAEMLVCHSCAEAWSE